MTDINEQKTYYTVRVINENRSSFVFYREFTKEYDTISDAIAVARRVKRKNPELMTDEYSIIIVKQVETVIDKL